MIKVTTRCSKCGEKVDIEVSEKDIFECECGQRFLKWYNQRESRNEYFVEVNGEWK